MTVGVQGHQTDKTTALTDSPDIVVVDPNIILTPKPDKNLINPSCLNKQDKRQQPIVSNTPFESQVKDTKPADEVHNKPPMVAVHELAKFNHIDLEYKTIAESGPSHNKIFTVILRLGNQEYEGSGSSIRKAQHAAAETALLSTTLRSNPKTSKKSKDDVLLFNPRCRGASTTPTVALNVLAMKLGETVSYQVTAPQTVLPPGLQFFDFNMLYDYRGSNPNQRHHFPKTPYSATVIIGSTGRTFTGTGLTPQGARHAAAEQALMVLQKELLQTSHVKANVDDKNAESGEDGKSPVTTIHEMANRMNWTVSFEVIASSGPVHVPCFRTRCVVDSYSVEGEGSNKRLSKKNAAEKMLELLKYLPVFQENRSSKSKPLNVNAAEFKNPIKQSNTKETNDDVFGKPDGSENNCRKEAISGQAVQKSNAGSVRRTESRDSESSVFSLSSNSSEEDGKTSPNGTLIDPINALQTFVIAHVSREDPKYKLIYERVEDKRPKEFVVECSVKDVRKLDGKRGFITRTAVGIDLIKRKAKKKAAEAMLTLLTTGRLDVPLPEKSELPSILKREPASPRKRRERTVSFSSDGGSSKKRDNIKDKTESSKKDKKKTNKCKKKNIAPGVIVVKTGLDIEKGVRGELSCYDITQILTNASNELDEGVPSIRQLFSLFKKFPRKEESEKLEPGDAFLRLQTLMNKIGGDLVMHVNDFPKGSSTESLTVITITTEPPLICHGSGVDLTSSRDEAALQVGLKVNELMKDHQELAKEDSGLESEEDKTTADKQTANLDTTVTTTNACDTKE